ATIRGEIAALRTETHQEFGKVRGEIGELRSEMHQGFREIRNDFQLFQADSRKWRNQKAQLVLLATSVLVSLAGLLIQ
ncbi:MAG: hypothetical protein ACKO2Q_06440, partial [Actinomycetota bacterium]